MNKYFKDVFEQGREARENAWEAESCPYRNNMASIYWLAGHGGFTYDHAKRFHEQVREDKRQIKSQLGFSRIGLNNV